MGYCRALHGSVVPCSCQAHQQLGSPGLCIALLVQLPPHCQYTVPLPYCQEVNRCTCMLTLPISAAGAVLPLCSSCALHGTSQEHAWIPEDLGLNPCAARRRLLVVPEVWLPSLMQSPSCMSPNTPYVLQICRFQDPDLTCCTHCSLPARRAAPHSTLPQPAAPGWSSRHFLRARPQHSACMMSNRQR